MPGFLLGTPSNPGRLNRLPVLLALALVSALAPGCHTAGYYAQAVHGHCRILARREPVEQVLARNDLDPQTRRKLERTLDIRAFAESGLGLPGLAHYRTYADLGRPYVVWNVYASPAFSVEPKRWWYPVVGGLSYRGYFSEAAARACASRWEARGYDTAVAGIDAYSTLGWFRDPLLDTFLDNEDLDLAALLFHELAHQRLFVRGDTRFNEAFATALAEEGVRRWLDSQGTAAERLAGWNNRLARRHAFVALAQQTREELKAFYAARQAPARGEGLSAVERAGLEAGKAAILDRLMERHDHLKTSWPAGRNFDRWFEQPVNNARLNTLATYFDWVPAFHRFLEEGCGGDIERFLDGVERAGRLDRKRRHAWVESWLPATTGE